MIPHFKEYKNDQFCKYKFLFKKKKPQTQEASGSGISHSLPSVPNYDAGIEFS